MNDAADLTQFSRISHPGKSFGRGHFTGNPRDISRPPSTFLVKINISQERTTGMESFLTLSKFALTKLVSMPVFGLSGIVGSAMVNPESSSHGDRSWHDDYLIGKSDMDAAWYYERLRWRS